MSSDQPIIDNAAASSLHTECASPVSSDSRSASFHSAQEETPVHDQLAATAVPALGRDTNEEAIPIPSRSSVSPFGADAQDADLLAKLAQSYDLLTQLGQNIRKDAYFVQWLGDQDLKPPYLTSDLHHPALVELSTRGTACLQKVLLCVAGSPSSIQHGIATYAAPTASSFCDYLESMLAFLEQQIEATAIEDIEEETSEDWFAAQRIHWVSDWLRALPMLRAVVDLKKQLRSNGHDAVDHGAMVPLELMERMCHVRTVREYRDVNQLLQRDYASLLP
jgi:hypothetical protein